MGKQVSFYMTHEDERDFLESVSQRSPIKVIYSTFPDPSCMVIESLAPVGRVVGDTHLSLVYAAPEAYIRHEFFSTRGYYCIDTCESEVVQFTRCERKGIWLTDGRLWFDEQSLHRRKSTYFVKWANSLLRWVRTHYRRDDHGYYLAPHALELSESGTIRLGHLFVPSISIEEQKRILDP